MKKQYEHAEMRLIEIDAEDVIVTSGPELDDNEMEII